MGAESAGRALAIGLSPEELKKLSVQSTKREHISAYFEPSASASPFQGVAPADLHNRAPREFDLITGGAQILGDGVVASSQDGNVTFLADASMGIQERLAE